MMSKRFVAFLFMIMMCVVFSNAQKRPVINRSIRKVNTHHGQSSTAVSSNTPKKQIAKKTTSYKSPAKKRSSAPHFNISSTSASFDYRGGSKSFTVSSSGKWEIEVYPANWGTLTRNGNTLVLNTSVNNSSSSRSDWFAIKSGNKSIRVDIYQSRGNYLDISSQEISLPSSGGSKVVTVSSGDNWQIGTNTDSWGHLTRSGSQLTLRVDANNSSSSRSDYFTIKSGTIEKRVNIIQEGKSQYFSVSSENLKFSYVGGAQTVTVYSDQRWEISVPTLSWGHLTKNENSVTVRVDANNTYSERTDYFCLKSGDITRKIYIKQEAKQNNYGYSSGSSYGSNNSYRNNNYTYSQQNPRAKWWKENFSVGVDGDFEVNTGLETMYYSAGLLFRFGQPKHLFNVMLGAKYRWISIKVEEYDYYGYKEKDRYNLLGGYLGIPLDVRFNVARFGRNSAFYLGAGGEYGILIAGKFKDELNKDYISVFPQMGYTSRHFDIGLYWKYYINNPLKEWRKNYFKKKTDYAIGLQMLLFF